MYKLTKINNRSGDTRTAFGKYEGVRAVWPRSSGHTSGFGVSSLPKDFKMITDEIVWNEIFCESRDESFKGFDEVNVGLNSITEENDANKEQENKDMWRRTCNLKVKLVMKCYLMSEPSKRRYRRSKYNNRKT